MNWAKILIEAGCVQLSPDKPFTYASGLIGPIYCDNRLLLSNVDAREKIINGLLQLMDKQQIDGICGIATAGIPHGAWMAQSLGCPFYYVRSEAKAHGKTNAIEGGDVKGLKLMVIEDLINQGKSSHQVCEHLINAGAQLMGLLAIVDYQFSFAKDLLNSLKLVPKSLVNFNQLLDYAGESDLFSQAQINSLRHWHRDPKNWWQTKNV